MVWLVRSADLHTMGGSSGHMLLGYCNQLARPTILPFGSGVGSRNHAESFRVRISNVLSWDAKCILTEKPFPAVRMDNQTFNLFLAGLLALGLVAWLVLKDKSDGVGAMGSSYYASCSQGKPAPGWGLQDRTLQCSGPTCGDDPIVYST